MEQPEKKRQLPRAEMKIFERFLFVLFAMYLLTLATVDQVYTINKELYQTNHNEITIEIPEDLDQEAQSLLIAQRLVANMEVSDEEVFRDGAHGALAQVIYDIPEETLNERYRSEIELSDDPHHLAIISYYMLDDLGSQTGEIIIGDWLVLRLRDWIFDLVNTLTPDQNIMDSHEFDIESTAFVLRETSLGVLAIEHVLIRHHGILSVYGPEILRTSGDDQRLHFVMTRGKHAIYPSTAYCLNEFIILQNFLSFSTDVCRPDQTIEYQISTADMIGPPGQSRNAIENNENLLLFPPGSDALGMLGDRAYSSFFP